MQQLRSTLRGLDLGRLVRFAAVSVVGVVVTQVLLFGGQVGFGVDPTTMNVVACTLAAAPVFVLNRRWVWSVDGPTSLRREIVPFWALTGAGLVLSTMAVAVVSTFSTAPLVISGTNMAAFGALWIVKYTMLDSLVFVPATPAAAEREPALELLAA